LNSSHLLGAVFVVMTLVLPLVVTITIVISALAGCGLRLASGWHWLNVRKMLIQIKILIMLKV
jgi:hypothetical protein